ncbi:hypothetical protein HU200_006755 [Digitaria exilis]|uniref:DUF6598 domain-containing protein n=1 Tax=Digitaria exilis TaxID=1010633 RepID=A0A835FPC5_9POAL|nr:hypothetical protein HU200_006754 [Digitaria exilis]KAF8769247.1 hypothetical protein HU200_006755 [Digitaria exilis]
MDLVLNGPSRILEAYGGLGLRVHTDDEVSSTDDGGSCTRPIRGSWDVAESDVVEEFTQTIDGGLGRKLELTYVVFPNAVETHVEVRLNLMDLGSRRRLVYGSVKASAIDYGGKSVHLFSRERGRSLSMPCGSVCILPLKPYMIALEDGQHFKLHIEVDLSVITSRDSQEEDKNFKLREFNDDQIEVNIMWRLRRS